MKKISLFALIGLIASFSLADIVYYPNNTYKIDGKVQFINQNQRPTWNDNGTAYGLATTNDITTIVGDYATKIDLQDATNVLYNSVSDNFVDNNELTQSNTTLSNNIMSVVSDNYIDNNELTQSNTTLSNNIMTAVSGSYIDDSELQNATNVLYNSVSNNFIDNTELVQNNTTLSNNIMSAVSDGYIDNSELLNATNALNTSIMGSVVKSINTKKGDLTITAGDNIDIDNSGNTEIKISAIASPRHSIKTWTDEEIEEFENSEIPTDKYAEQYFPAPNGDYELTLGTNDISEVGTLVLYFYQDHNSGTEYDLINTNGNIINFPSTHFWLEETSLESIWKLELEAIPGTEKWYFKKATEYVLIPLS